MAWQNLGAVILDAERELSGKELALIDIFLKNGCNVILTRPCYRANAALRRHEEKLEREVREATERLLKQAGATNIEQVRGG